MRVGGVRALRDHGVVGHGADAAGHVGHAHRVGDVLALHQRALRQLAGQVEAAAGLGRGDAFGLVQRAGGGQRGGQAEGCGARGWCGSVSPCACLHVNGCQRWTHDIERRLSAGFQQKRKSVRVNPQPASGAPAAARSSTSSPRPSAAGASRSAPPWRCGDRAHDRQAEAGAGLRRRCCRERSARRRAPVSSAGMPGPSSTTVMRTRPASRRTRTRHLAAARRVADRVVQQVGQRLLQQPRLRRAPAAAGLRLEAEVDALLARMRPPLARQVLRPAPPASTGSRLQLGAVGARQRQHLVGLAHRLVELRLDAPAAPRACRPGRARAARSRPAWPAWSAACATGARRRRRSAAAPRPCSRLRSTWWLMASHQRPHVGRDARWWRSASGPAAGARAPRWRSRASGRSAQAIASTSSSAATSTSSRSRATACSTSARVNSLARLQRLGHLDDDALRPAPGRPAAGRAARA